MIVTVGNSGLGIAKSVEVCIWTAISLFGLLAILSPTLVQFSLCFAGVDVSIFVVLCTLTVQNEDTLQIGDGLLLHARRNNSIRW
jgi:low affinity Fe/Cu permease